jgi:hypothetical protein
MPPQANKEAADPELFSNNRIVDFMDKKKKVKNNKSNTQHKHNGHHPYTSEEVPSLLLPSLLHRISKAFFA